MGHEQHRNVHVVVVPCPTQGHVNPLLQFAKHLVHQGLKVTLPTIFTTTPNSTYSSLNIEQVPMLPYDGTEPETPNAFWIRRIDSIRLHLKELIARFEGSDDSVSCIVYDSMMSWILDIAREFRVLGASFFTQSSAVNAIYYNVYKGWLDIDSLHPSLVSLEGLPEDLQPSDLSTFLSGPIKNISMVEFTTNQFVGLNDADWILVNTFDSLESQECEWMRKHFPFKSIGPMVPSTYLNGWLPNDKDYGLSLFKSNSNYSIMKWLDSKQDNSVIYISFGSLTEAKEKLMEEVAWGIKQSNKSFLWVVRESETHKLPHNFIEETKEKGLVVKWCPQLQVLAHTSVGCFVTHCGWNSTLEGLSLGVPLVAMPLWSDQPTNAKYVEDVWKIGKRVRMDEDGNCTRLEIEECINEVMEGEEGKQIRENLNKWRELAKASMDEGGSSNTNLNQFVQQLMRNTQL